jgi:hypothetical protein
MVMLIACAIGFLAPAFSQEYRGTMEQQMACTPDVWRLCAAQIPDVNRIVACLKQNNSQLSEHCRAVFSDSSASVPPSPEPRVGGDRARSYDR